MSATASTAVKEAVFALLQDATLQAALGGRLFDRTPPGTARPSAFYEVFNERDVRGFGTGNMPQCDLRTLVYSDVGSMSEAEAINDRIVALLKDAAISVTGFTQCGRIVYHESVPLPDEQLNGVPVHEIVALFTLWVEDV